MVYFNQSSYSVEGSDTFWTSVMISAVDYFWGVQFDIEYDHTLIEARPNAARRGTLYDVNAGNWTEADFLSVTAIEDGLVRLQISWESYPGEHGGCGIDTSGGILAHLKWKATGSTGANGLDFTGTKRLVGFGPQPTDEWAYKGVIWKDSSVSVH
jgi:hypothetical protein